MHALRFSEEEKDGDYKVIVLDDILGSGVADVKAKKFREMNLLNTRTRSEVLQNKIQWSNLVSGKHDDVPE